MIVVSDQLCSQVIVIRDGIVTETGPYYTLLKCCLRRRSAAHCLRAGGDFSRFISEHQQLNESETDEIDSETRILQLKV